MLLVALVSAVLPLVLYALTLGPSFYWLDSGEFVAAAWTLGVAHPPGHPLPSLFARLVCYLPMGTIAQRVALASAIETALACALLALIAERLVRRLAGDRWFADGARRAAVRVVSVALALTAAASYALWFQATRAEVYALNLMLALAVLYALLRWEDARDGRWLLGAALVGGLALCNHHLLALLALVPAVGFVFWRWRATQAASVNWRRGLIGVIVAGTVGLSVLVYLPLRSQRAPVVDWGAPHNWTRFVWVVSAREFQKSVRRASREPLEQRTAGALFAVIGGPPTDAAPALAGGVEALLAVFGLYIAWRRRELRSAAGLLSAMLAANLASPMFVGLDPYNPDAHGYLELSVALLVPLAVLPLASLIFTFEDRHHQVWAWALAAVVLALPLAQLRANAARCDLRQHWATEETARALLDQPPGTLLLTSYYQSIFGSWALQSTADYRPDVDVFHRNFLRQPGYVENAAARWPALGAVFERWSREGAPNVVDLDRLVRQRTIAFEYDLNLPPAITARLLPDGLTLDYEPLSVRISSQRTLLARHRQRSARWLDAVGPPDDPETVRALAWDHYLLARFACTRQLLGMAQLELDAALKLAPASRDTRELRRMCLRDQPR